MPRKVGTYYRDAKGRFASKNTPGAIEFQSNGVKKRLSPDASKRLTEVKSAKAKPKPKETKPVKVETSLAKKRKEKKLERLRQYEDSKSLANLAQSYYGKTVHDANHAKQLGVKKGEQLGYKRLKTIQDERDSLAARVAPTKRFKQEKFKSGEPLSDDQMRKPLSEHELSKLAGGGKLPKVSDAHTSEGKARAKKLQEDFKEAKKTAPELSEEEFKAVREYTRGSGYIAPNAAARGLFKDPNSEIAREAVTKVRLIDNALAKLPDYKGEVRRDTSLPTEEFKRYAQGERIKLYGVTSTTTDLQGKYTKAYGNANLSQYNSVAKESSKSSKYHQESSKLGILSATSSESVRVEYRMNVSSGKSIKGISVESGEAEVALRHGWTGVVRKIEKIGDNHYRVEVDE